MLKWYDRVKIRIGMFKYPRKNVAFNWNYLKFENIFISDVRKRQKEDRLEVQVSMDLKL